MNALDWIRASVPAVPPPDVYCETRDVAESRIIKALPVFLAAGWSKDAAGLFVGVMGELAGNCFDHNLGRWPDIPGCWLDIHVNGTDVRVQIADRGIGVLATLRQTLPDLRDARDALRVAFTQIVTGRAPEKRGNGLKFVLGSLRSFPTAASFVFLSGDAKLDMAGPMDFSDIPKYIGTIPSAVAGTYAEIIFKNL